MAEADYMARLAQLESGKGVKKNPIDLLVERFKIEDFVNENHGVESEHFLFLKASRRG